jgi:hypothetical protein
MTEIFGAGQKGTLSVRFNTRRIAKDVAIGLLTGAAGQINGTTSDEHNIMRAGVGNGGYSLGAPRQIEFGLRLTF